MDLDFTLVTVGFEHTINIDTKGQIKGLLARSLRFNSKTNLTLRDSHNLNSVQGDAGKGR
jgi:hypothetical protein